jgi:uncharacterized protein (DUF362 family)
MPDPTYETTASGPRQAQQDKPRRATVAIAHTNEKHRSRETVYDLVKEALSHLGGISRFVKPGQRVLIKPNVTVFYTAEEGCTTDPLIVGALVRMCKEAGASRIQVGESSGGMFSSLSNMKITGIAPAAKREGAELIDLGSDKTPNRYVQVPKGRVLHDVPLPAPLLDADVIIDVPKAKNHEHTTITGALKNWVGVVNQHWRQFNHGGTDTAARFMDIMTVVPPDLCVVDAIICGEGDGPIANQPHWCGCVLASEDPVATDVTIARLLGHDWQHLDYLNEAEARGLGVKEPIDYAGAPLDKVSFKAWHNHSDINYLPINMLVGKGVTMEGTIGHVKSALDSMVRRGELRQVIWLKGTPTIMLGEIDDPNFEKHLAEGPYLVFDDAAKPEYKNHPGVFFVAGHPVLRQAMPNLIKGLGAEIPGNTILKLQQFHRWGMSNLKYGDAGRKAITVGETLGAVALAVAAAVGVAALAKRI